ncbi:PD-(D/E)XK nuclease family protein [Patescibacteria group bacterium]|nr:PD-(D/E)XK nuclease family protein [Patescibacteria group bacterium]
MSDKYSAVWVSHSSLSDFVTCPQLYYLKNVYKRPETGHKMTIMSPALALGQAVHDVVESLSTLQTEQRFREPLLMKLSTAWEKVSGKKGGFSSPEQELRYRQRAEEMVRRVEQHPGPLKNLAVKINMDLPHYWLSPEDQIILCGKVDWLEYLPDTNMVNIIDFKTGKNEEKEDSLQLPIYCLLVANCQKRKVAHACYWYLQYDDNLTEKELPDLATSHQRVLELAKQVKLARKLNRYKCPGGESCRACEPFLKVQRGEAEFVGVNSYNTDVFVINYDNTPEEDSIIL